MMQVSLLNDLETCPLFIVYDGQITATLISNSKIVRAYLVSDCVMEYLFE
jgi:hypothetical protein